MYNKSNHNYIGITEQKNANKIYLNCIIYIYINLWKKKSNKVLARKKIYQKQINKTYWWRNKNKTNRMLVANLSNTWTIIQAKLNFEGKKNRCIRERERHVSNEKHVNKLIRVRFFFSFSILDTQKKKYYTIWHKVKTINILAEIKTGFEFEERKKSVTIVHKFLSN